VNRHGVQGSRVHQGVREPYGAAFGEADVVGCYIHLPPNAAAVVSAAPKELVTFKGAPYQVLAPTEVDLEGLWVGLSGI
jgi:hypothetical protein